MHHISCYIVQATIFNHIHDLLVSFFSFVYIMLKCFSNYSVRGFVLTAKI